MDHLSADRPTSTATLPRRPAPVETGAGRFSPQSAQQREVVDAFLSESRPWALRQARRSYRHLPESLREQAVDRAYTELRTRVPQSSERRALAAELAERLTEALRHIHVGWCLNESSALLRREGTEPVQPEVHRDGLATFVDEGLGGLERAVLQLEIGAGRDTRTARAALRLGPRQYATHRDAGLSKLRDAISAQVIGRACDQHVSSIVAAATGDKTAMEELSGGPHRCRYCAREAQGLRSVLHERLAVAPWPLAIAPAGILASKFGAVGAVFGAKSATAGGALSAASGSGASAAATVLAAAALATGTAAIVDKEGTDRSSLSTRTAQAVEKSAGAGKTSKSRRSTAVKASGGKAAVGSGGKAGLRPAPAAAQGTTGFAAVPEAPATKPPSTVASTSAPVPASGSEPVEADGPVTTAAEPVTGAVEGVADEVTSRLPPVVAQPVDQTVDNVTDVVDDAGAVVDQLVP